MTDLTDALLTVDVDDATGAITRIWSSDLGAELLREPRLAGSFRLLLPAPGFEGNYVDGADQRPPTIEGGASEVTLRWQGPLRSANGDVDVDVEQRLELSGGELRVALCVRNGSPYPLAEVWSPMLGGITGVGDRETTMASIPRRIPGSTDVRNLFRRFRGNGYELGTPGPEYLFTYPGELSMSWGALYNPEVGGGFYLGCHDVVARTKVLRFTLSPGSGHGRDDPWPRADEVPDGVPVGVETSWVFFPYTAEGETFEAPPVVIRPFRGADAEAAAIYRGWFDAQFTLPDVRASTYRAQHAIQDLMFMLPEGNVMLRFEDMGEWARAAASHGVKAVLVSGWNRGGHDAEYPHYEPDPRLGTWAELEAGIAACHAEGVQVYFFVNVQTIDVNTDWYRDELHRYRSMDRFGASKLYGFGMGTVGARLRETQPSLVFASPDFPQFRELLVRQMRRLAEIGADGLHIDKLAWNLVLLDFNPDLSLGPDTAPWEGILSVVREIRDACVDVNREFGLSWEGHWDRLLEFGDVAWAWHPTWEADYLDLFKLAFPRWLPAIGVSQPFDYAVVNNAVRFGYQLLIGPRHYTRSMDDLATQPLSRYIGEIGRMRDELSDSIFYGDFLGDQGATVHAGADVQYAVHRDPATGQRACVITNRSAGSEQFELAFSDVPSGARGVLHRPFSDPETIELPLRAELGAGGLAIVVELAQDGQGRA